MKSEVDSSSGSYPLSISSVPPPAPDRGGGWGGHEHRVPAPRAEPRRRLPRLHRVRARVPAENICTSRKYLNTAHAPVVSEAGAVVAGEVAAQLVVVDGAGAAVGLRVPEANIFS